MSIQERIARSARRRAAIGSCGRADDVTVPVPRKLQAKVGKTKLKRCLKTDSLRVANSLKWPIVSELKKQIRLSVQGTVHDPLLEEAKSS
jgi:hypothetical protein